MARKMFLSTSSNNEVDGSDHEKETHHDGYDGFDDDYDDDDDDDEQLLSVGPSAYNNPLSSSSQSSHTAGTYIRMEGWLNYTTSSHKDNNTIPPPSNTSSGGGGTSSSISKTSSKRKKSRSSKKNKQRYFVLRGSILSYYARRHDVKAKGTFVITKGCTVGPVVFTSLDDATADSSHKQGETNTYVGGLADHAYEGEQQPQQPLSPSTKQQKKKQRHLYCVQVTWPTNNKPSKDEKFMAQAKAQVAAESEFKEALQLQQQQQQDDSFDNDSVVNLPPPHNNGTKSPTIMRSKQFMRRSKSETVSTPQRKGSDSGTIRRSLHLDGGDIPPELSTPILSGDDNGDIIDGVDRDITNGQKHVVASILPVSKLDNTTLNTPAAALSGSVAVPKKIPKVAIAVPPTTSESNAADKLNHETGLQKHYKHQIEKHTRDQQKTAEELQKVQQLISRKESHQKTKKKVIQGTKVAAGATAAM